MKANAALTGTKDIIMLNTPSWKFIVTNPNFKFKNFIRFLQPRQNIAPNLGDCGRFFNQLLGILEEAHLGMGLYSPLKISFL